MTTGFMTAFLSFLPQGSDVGNELQQAFFADKALERGHDGLIPGDNLGGRVQHRFADVAFVGEYHLPALQPYRLPEQSHQRRSTPWAIGAMARGTPELLKQPLTRRDQ